MTQPSDRPVTEDELREWEASWRGDDGSSCYAETCEKALPRLIAALREARAAQAECVSEVSRWATEAGTLRYKLAEIRAVVKEMSQALQVLPWQRDGRGNYYLESQSWKEWNFGGRSGTSAFVAACTR